jgi:hypothetical protein
VLGLRLQLESLVVQIVDGFSVALEDCYLFTFLCCFGFSLWEDVVLGVDKDVECREDVLLIDDCIDSFATAL